MLKELKVVIRVTKHVEVVVVHIVLIKVYCGKPMMVVHQKKTVQVVEAQVEKDEVKKQETNPAIVGNIVVALVKEIIVLDQIVGTVVGQQSEKVVLVLLESQVQAE